MSRAPFFRSGATPWDDASEMALWAVAAVIGAFFAHNFIRRLHK